jgi:phosphatidate cytidylyltransferase
MVHQHVVFADAQLLPFATNHRILSFTLYTIGFMGFVMSLKKGYLKQQFGLFCWVHMTLLLVVVSRYVCAYWYLLRLRTRPTSHFIVNNILEGLIWFWVPASLVICNDVFAYIWGVSFGRTPLIKLSPKKTVEGFVGAFFSTIIFGMASGPFFMRFNYMLCPVHDLGVSAWTATGCTPNPVFVWRQWDMWKPLAILASTIVSCLRVPPQKVNICLQLRRPVTTITYAPYQWHLLFMSCFASLVAPFGGFFASGFKRAFDIKDFGQSIPGHGGMTDRMDCQCVPRPVCIGYLLTLVIIADF